MKLLFDQNLSPKLVKEFGSAFPGSLHVRSVHLQAAPDAEVWEFAKTEGFTVVTKDVDFGDMVLVFGFPPKVIWIRRGNCSTGIILALLFKHVDAIFEFENREDAGILMIV